MTIELMTPEAYAELNQIFNDYPILTYQNKDYDGIDRSKFNKEEQQADKRVAELLKAHVHDFVRFQNFTIDKQGLTRARIQYRWDERFTGVGYLPLETFIKGFNPND